MTSFPRGLFGFALYLVPICFADSAAAQQIIGSYQTTIGEADLFNSSGKRLWDFCAIIQQDRANFHKFRLRDGLDEFDPFFTTAKARSVISKSCSAGGLNAPFLKKNVVSYGGTVFVEVYGQDDRISEVVVYDVGG